MVLNWYHCTSKGEGVKNAKILLKNKKREITLVVVSSMVLALFFSGYSMGKGFTSVDIYTNAKIAKPILMVENSPVIKVDGRKEKEYYDFKVKNYNEKGEITQIDLEYNIEILSQVERAICFKLYNNNHEIVLENNKTTNRKLQKENKQEEYYRLEIIYDKTKNNNSDDIIQDVQIKVHSEQMRV